jgi:hypothetical protein
MIEFAFGASVPVSMLIGQCAAMERYADDLICFTAAQRRERTHVCIDGAHWAAPRPWRVSDHAVQVLSPGRKEYPHANEQARERWHNVCDNIVRAVAYSLCMDNDCTMALPPAVLLCIASVPLIRHQAGLWPALVFIHVEIGVAVIHSILAGCCAQIPAEAGQHVGCLLSGKVCARTYEPRLRPTVCATRSQAQPHSCCG